MGVRRVDRHHVRTVDKEWNEQSHVWTKRVYPRCEVYNHLLHSLSLCFAVYTKNEFPQMSDFTAVNLWGAFKVGEWLSFTTLYIGTLRALLPIVLPWQSTCCPCTWTGMVNIHIFLMRAELNVEQNRFTGESNKEKKYCSVHKHFRCYLSFTCFVPSPLQDTLSGVLGFKIQETI